MSEEEIVSAVLSFDGDLVTESVMETMSIAKKLKAAHRRL